ncbi:MAG: hypothetical protein HQ546_02960 [Planctomycetes bacterium]|nr:hypothetical protein [Planctomycetota bacterium]
MPVDRPTFSESWYRVAALRPRLRSTVQVHRQHYRGQLWYVLQDPSNNQFYRQNEAAYHFVALLDGRRTMAEVWEACNQQLGDSAPTQGEAIQLMGQLYASNLIQCELPPDAQGLFQMYKKRVHREVKSYLTNLLFIRIPLIDPDRFLEKWVGVFGKIFTLYGLAVWLVLVSVGLYFVIGKWGALANQAESVLDPANLPLLYVSFILIKVFHEFGHAFACKKFGLQAGGGEVHVMGVMFLVFNPLPYVDASSSWAFRERRRRVTVAAAGMFVELAVASIAAVIWARTSTDNPVHAITYNMMFIASVSTVLFNANPLLRFDGYYILSDLLEIPNLRQRATQYLQYLVKRYAWSVRHARNPAHTQGERAWFVFYGTASTIYMFFLYSRILLFVADKLFFLGMLLAMAAFVMWVLVPLGKLVRYLFTSPELMRSRGRAMLSVMGVLALAVIGFGLIPAPDRHRAQGVVEPDMMMVVYAQTDGKVTNYLPSGVVVSPGNEPLVQAENPELSAKKKQLLVDRNIAEIRRRQAQAEGETAKYQALGEQVAALNEHIAQVTQELAHLTVTAKVPGTWVAPNIDRMLGAYAKRGDRIGLVASLDELIIRSTATQDEAVQLIGEALRAGVLKAEIRVKGRPDLTFTGSAGPEDIRKAGGNQLPSASLGYNAGGSMATASDDRQGMKTTERFFEIRIRPQLDSQASPPVILQPGQRVVVRFDMPNKPLIAQWWRSLLQLVQRRFNV